MHNYATELSSIPKESEVPLNSNNAGTCLVIELGDQLHHAENIDGRIGKIQSNMALRNISKAM